VYHIVALQAHKPRNARPLEKLGEYDPVARLKSVQDIPMANRIFGNKQKKAPEIVEKRIEWDVERIKWWLGNGAEPTKTVLRLLEQVSQPSQSTRWVQIIGEGVLTSW
jgi:small subunit ribosomal protein S16